MKISKNILHKLLVAKLADLNYTFVKDSLTGSDGLFIKMLSNGYYLSLGLVISRHFHSKFTAAYYLSLVTRWGSIWGDIPRESYKRVSTFLSSEERRVLLKDEYCKEGIIDGWWDAFNEKEVDNFINTIKITEKRFLDQPRLMRKLELSRDIGELVDYANFMKREISKKITPDYKFENIPNKSIDDIPLEWFKHAEIVIKSKGGILNENTVKLLAADVWRQNIVSK